MEDLEIPTGSPALSEHEQPQALDDAADPLAPAIDEEDNEPADPLMDGDADQDTYEKVPESRNEHEDPDLGTTANDALDSDVESELEELSEKEFDDFDPSALNIPDKPVAVDADNVGLLGVHKRKRTEEEERERKQKKKKKEGRRERPKKAKRVRAGADGNGDEEDEPDFEGGPEMDGKRVRRGKGEGGGGAPRKAPRARTPENEENLSVEERRRRALDRKMDEALKSHRAPTRRRGVHNLEEMADAEIEVMRQKMAKACEADADARSRGEIATHKLKILPEVVELLNRNTIQSQLVDPDTNILEAVRFMLEPADHDAALPNYQIQRELFTTLRRLPVGKEALKASGIGKVVLFYTKSIQPQQDIKRHAERLIGEWMRIVLGKETTTRKNMSTATKVYDPLAQAAAARAQGRSGVATEMSAGEKMRVAAEKRRAVLAMPMPGNRARADGSGLPTYSVAPVNNLSNAHLGGVRGAGTGSNAAFNKIVAKSEGGKKKR
ncbi:Transcription factor iws1 [Recurvomyces mirabilis]|nr:Transcription factor iws1 [Recurvomyces mirabilis]